MAEALHQGIPQSSLRIIKGGRHLTPIECPDEIASEIANLLERI
jgi:pimeloyl-ACP methyl ester carboxylesterase